MYASEYVSAQFFSIMFKENFQKCVLKTAPLLNLISKSTYQINITKNTLETTYFFRSPFFKKSGK